MQVRRMQREMDVLSRQSKLLQKRFGKDVVDAARKDAERLRDQDELSYLGGPIRIKTNYAPKEEKLRDIKVTCSCTFALAAAVYAPVTNMIHKSRRSRQNGTWTCRTTISTMCRKRCLCGFSRP